MLSFTDTGFREFTFVQNDLKFKKVSQAFDIVQMNPCSSDEKECPVFLDSARLAICLGQ